MTFEGDNIEGEKSLSLRSTYLQAVQGGFLDTVHKVFTKSEKTPHQFILGLMGNKPDIKMLSKYMQVSSLFTKPVVRNRKGDMTKKWYIEYYYVNPVTKEKQRIQSFGNINSVKKLGERNKLAKLYCETIHEMLLDGWSPFENTEKMGAKYNAITVEDAIKKFLEVKSKITTAGTVKAYKPVLLHFQSYVAKNLIKLKFLNEIDRKHISQYLDDILYKEEFSIKNRNKYLETLTTLFNYYCQEEYLEVNPTLSIKKFKTEKVPYTPYGAEMKDKVLSALKEKDRDLLMVVYFIYYLAIRPKELLLLRIENINFEKGVLFIPATTRVEGKIVKLTKNGKSEHLSIPEQFRSYLIEKGYDKQPGSNFIVGRSCKPSPFKFTTRRLNERWINFRTKEKIPEEYKLYAWKHTAAEALIRAGFTNLKSIQDHFRHHSIQQTEDYIGSHGGNIDQEIRFNYPSL